MIDHARAVHEAIAAHREALVRRFGFTELDVRAVIDLEAQRVVLEGRVLARRFAANVAAAVQAVLPEGFTVDAARVQPGAPGPWHAIVGDPTPVLAAIPGEGRRAGLATELRPADGPVQHLAAHAGHTLVRAVDGTMGWTSAALGEIVPTPRFDTPSTDDGCVFVAAVRRYVGAPYRLGGTTEAGIDCSGLVVRALRDVDAGVVPRHSSDQLAIDPREGAGAGDPGDLVFVWTHAEAPCHVGVCDGEGAVVHASRLRGVVVDERVGWMSRAERVRHVPWGSIVGLQGRLRGAAAMDDVMELGRRA